MDDYMLEADLAAAAIFDGKGEEPDPAIIVDQSVVGNPWFLIYSDNSALDSRSDTWEEWTNLVDAAVSEIPPDRMPVLYLTAETSDGRRMIDEVAEYLKSSGFEVREAPES